MSERAARREHARIIEDVNRRRGSVAPAYRGQTFSDIVEKLLLRISHLLRCGRENRGLSIT